MKISMMVVALAMGFTPRPSQAQDACCSTDADCVALQSQDQIDYNDHFGKTLVCDTNCPGLINCNMFGLCEYCRGCFQTCEGALTYLDETGGPEDSVGFCPNAEVAELSECYSDDDGSAGASGSASGASSAVGSGTGSGMGSGSTSMRGSASGSGSGVGSAGNSASGSGFGSGVASASGAASGSGMGSASSSMSGSASGSGMGSASSSMSGSASGSGMGSGSVAGDASASASAGRMAEIPGCLCGDVELDDAQSGFFCENGKSMYCDVECVPGSDPMERLFYEMGGLWCQPMGYYGCRLCKFDCSDYEDDYCVPCPDGVKEWC